MNALRIEKFGDTYYNILRIHPVVISRKGWREVRRTSEVRKAVLRERLQETGTSFANSERRVIVIERKRRF